MKKTIFLPALLLLAGCADSPAENFAKAQDAFARHDYPVARVTIASALAKQPGDRAMLLLQARTLLALGDGEGAGSALEKLIGTSPAKAELSAEAALLRQAPDVALAVLGDANSVEADRLRALAAIQKRDTAKAGDYFAKAMAAGGNARVFADYCRFRLTAGDVAGAKELADRAAKASPDGIDTLLVGGLLALRQGDLKKSLELYGRAAKLYPTSLAALTGQAAVLGDLGRFDQMEAALARASAFAPKDPTVVYLSARAAAARKDWSAVRAAVQPIEAGLPQQDPIRLLYGEALLRLGQSELAMAQFTPMTRSGPGARLAVRLLGEAQLVSGDAQSALATLRPLALLSDVRPAAGHRRELSHRQFALPQPQQRFAIQ
jgi:tetratricopeptide (TPR) repeat protein